MRRGPRHSDEHGFALIIVLWSIVLLTLLGMQLIFAGRVETRLASNVRGAADVEVAADGALQTAIFHLIDAATRWPADGVERQIRNADTSVIVTIQNEGGKINPNLAAPALMSALLRHLGVDALKADSLADCIADWRFPGTQPRPHGAKAEQYRAAGLTYGPPGAPFRSISELGSVLGMTPAILARLAPFVTVSTDSDADPGLAAPPVRAAMVELLGALEPAATPTPPRTVVVTARALGKGGEIYIRRATIRLGLTPKEPIFQILTWETG